MARSISFAWISLLFVASFVHPARAQECTSALGFQDLLNGRDSPCVFDRGTLSEEHFDVLNASHQHERDDVLEALRALVGAAQPLGPWGERFAQSLHIAIVAQQELECREKAGRREKANNTFAKAGPVSGNACNCLWTAGRPRSAQYICVRTDQDPACDTTKYPGGVYTLENAEQAQIALTYTMRALDGLVSLSEKCRSDAQKRLDEAQRKWERLRDYGYLQYPWELFASRAFDAYDDYTACFASDEKCTGEEGLDPNRHRLILLHPGVGFGFSGLGFNDDLDPSADASLVVDLELLGATHYFDDFRWYLGYSIGLGINDGDFADPRFGLFAHVTRWLHVGYLLSVAQADTRWDGTLFVSADLASVVAGGLDVAP